MKKKKKRVLFSSPEMTIHLCVIGFGLDYNPITAECMNSCPTAFMYSTNHRLKNIHKKCICTEHVQNFFLH
jgi:hypothetical protein